MTKGNVLYKKIKDLSKVKQALEKAINKGFECKSKIEELEKELGKLWSEYDSLYQD